MDTGQQPPLNCNTSLVILRQDVPIQDSIPAKRIGHPCRAVSPKTPE